MFYSILTRKCDSTGGGLTLKPDLRRVGDHEDFQRTYFMFGRYASLK